MLCSYFPVYACHSLRGFPSTPALFKTHHPPPTACGLTCPSPFPVLLSPLPLPAGYHAPDFQVAALVADKLETLKLSYAHNLTPSTTVGAEVTRKLSTSDTTFALAYARKLNNGALTKIKVGVRE